MTDEKDTTVGQFVAQSDETPDSFRVSLDEDEVQVVNEDDLPDSAKSSGNSGQSEASSDQEGSVSGHSRGSLSGDSPIVLEADLDIPDVVKGDLVVKRVYVEDPTEVPEGVELRTGERGGLYFEETALEFRQTMFDLSVEEVEHQDKYQYEDEQIERAVQIANEVQDKSQDIFSTWVNLAESVGADIAEASHRTKGVGSALEKAHQREDKSEQYEDVSDLTDWHGSKVVLDDTEQVHDTFEALEDEIPEEDFVKVNNHFENSASDPYRAYNLKVEVEGVVSELQIMSEEMAEIKSVSHAMILKPDKEAPTHLDEIPDDYDKDHPLKDDIEDCLTQEADALEGEIAPDDVSCSAEAQQAIMAVLEDH